MLSFATFWEGSALSALEKACLQSLTNRGHRVVVYSYNELHDLPEGVAWDSANEIVSSDLINSFMYNGKPNLAPFSNYFRYKMFSATGHTWIDADVVLLKAAEKAFEGNFLVRERHDSINNAVMRLDNSHPMLVDLINASSNAAGRDLTWGETGPKLITRLMKKYPDVDIKLFEQRVFYPIHHDDFWKPFHPRFLEECKDKCANAHGVHLWNNIVVNAGIWKDLAPPDGSYLHELFKTDGTLRYFREKYPAPVIEKIVENWQYRKNGMDVNFKELLKRLIPAAVRSVKTRTTQSPRKKRRV